AAPRELSGVKRYVAWAVWTLALTLVFGRIAAYNLGNYRPVSNDEGELMAVAYKLVNQGVLGSDLYAGFAGADQHFLITLPLQHVFEAISFRLFGPGVAQARWVSVVAGVTLVGVVSWLAYRWYGLAAAMICGVLLVAWPSNLTAAPNGLPLLGVARAARYDVLAVAFAWLAIALLDVALRRPGRGIGFGLGVCCGLAALAQFIGAFVLPLVLVNWLWARGRRGLVEPVLAWFLAGTGLVWLPWLVIVARYHADMTAQLTVYGSRWDVLNPRFYLLNILGEGSRYQGILRWAGADSADPSVSNSPGSQFLLVTAIWPALTYVIWRTRQSHAVGDRLLWSSVVTFGGLLVLVDQTKTPLYAIILLPSICMALAVACTAVWRWTAGRRRVAWRSLGPRAGLVCLGIIVATDGGRAYQAYLDQSARVSHYLGVGLQLQDALSPGAPVLGPERWWWALHDYPYTSLRSIWFQWSAEASSGRRPQFSAWATSTQADALLVNDNVRADVRDFPEALQQQFWAFVSTCTTSVLDLTDAFYLRIEVDRITRPPPDLEVCGGRP
ncbi:MAG: hypothetical protein LC797_20170, partial [Chloroflexi bacterium]|nr:hypothetical protein [Chloroflexota bacterium]